MTSAEPSYDSDLVKLKRLSKREVTFSCGNVKVDFQSTGALGTLVGAHTRVISRYQWRTFSHHFDASSWAGKSSSMVLINCPLCGQDLSIEVQVKMVRVIDKKLHRNQYLWRSIISLIIPIICIASIVEAYYVPGVAFKALFSLLGLSFVFAAFAAFAELREMLRYRRCLVQTRWRSTENDFSCITRIRVIGRGYPAFHSIGAPHNRPILFSRLMAEETVGTASLSHIGVLVEPSDSSSMGRLPFP
jgi:hypothetical protein